MSIDRDRDDGWAERLAAIAAEVQRRREQHDHHLCYSGGGRR